MAITSPVSNTSSELGTMRGASWPAEPDAVPDVVPKTFIELLFHRGINIAGMDARTNEAFGELYGRTDTFPRTMLQIGGLAERECAARIAGVIGGRRENIEDIKVAWLELAACRPATAFDAALAASKVAGKRNYCAHLLRDCRVHCIVHV
jgi:hypothetical protein